MIRGSVLPTREAIVRLTLRGAQGQELQLDVIVDTGFSGDLLLPRIVVDRLGLDFEGLEGVVLADGGEREVPAYRCLVDWAGRPRRAWALCAEGDALMGMSLLWHHILTLRAEDDGTLVIWPVGEEAP